MLLNLTNLNIIRKCYTILHSCSWTCTYLALQFLSPFGPVEIWCIKDWCVLRLLLFTCSSVYNLERIIWIQYCENNPTHLIMPSKSLKQLIWAKRWKIYLIIESHFFPGMKCWSILINNVYLHYQNILTIFHLHFGAEYYWNFTKCLALVLFAPLTMIDRRSFSPKVLCSTYLQTVGNSSFFPSSLNLAYKN